MKPSFMDINFGGNTLTNGYCAGTVAGPHANGTWIIKSAAYTAAALPAWADDSTDQFGYDGGGL